MTTPNSADKEAPPMNDYDEDRLLAAVLLVGHTGAKDFEFGYLTSHVSSGLTGHARDGAMTIRPTVSRTTRNIPLAATCCGTTTPNDGRHRPGCKRYTEPEPVETTEPEPEPHGIWTEVAAERDRAHAKHGPTSMESMPVGDPDGARRDILMEEVGEVAREFNEARHDHRPVDLGKVRKELIQVAAMAGAWADAISRDHPEPNPEPAVWNVGDLCIDGNGDTWQRMDSRWQRVGLRQFPWRWNADMVQPLRRAKIVEADND